MFGEISDLLVNSLKPVNQNILLMGLPSGIPDKLYSYLYIVYPEIFSNNGNILKYEEKMINGSRYAYIIVKDSCMKDFIIDEDNAKYGCMEDIILCEGIKTYLFILSDYWLDANHHNIDKNLPSIMMYLVLFFLNGVSNNTNLNDCAKPKYGSNFVLLHIIQIIYINWMMIVFEGISAIKLKEIMFPLLSDKLSKELTENSVKEYMSIVADITIYDLLDNSFIAGDVNVFPKKARLKTREKEENLNDDKFSSSN